MLSLKSEKTIAPGYLPLVEGTHVDDNGSEVVRLKVVRPDASAVLLYNTDSQRFILTQQYRYPIGGPSIEIIAGKVDSGEAPESAAIREVLEETGYQVTEDRLQRVVSISPSPGYAQEVIHIFTASVCDADKVSDGGGLASEHEDIALVNFTALELLNAIERGEIIDAKSIAAITIQALKLSL